MRVFSGCRRIKAIEVRKENVVLAALLPRKMPRDSHENPTKKINVYLLMATLICAYCWLSLNNNYYKTLPFLFDINWLFARLYIYIFYQRLAAQSSQETDQVWLKHQTFYTLIRIFWALRLFQFLWGRSLGSIYCTLQYNLRSPSPTPTRQKL